MQPCTTDLLRRAFLKIYLKAYPGLRPLPDDEIEVWISMPGAAGLNERIPIEEAALLRLAKAALRTCNRTTA